MRPCAVGEPLPVNPAAGVVLFEGATVPLYVCLPLFGNPGRELEEGAAVRGKDLRTLAADLNERLLKAADDLDKLLADGWSAEVAMYEALLTHSAVATREDAERRVRALGIDPNGLMIVEEIDEDDEG
jgi:hypothetical protein